MRTKFLCLLCFLAIYGINCKSSTNPSNPAIQYDIRGSWTLNRTWTEGGSIHISTGTISFEGSSTSGTWTQGQISGTYSVTGATVNWSGTTRSFTGAFTGQNRMAGNFTDGSISGTWEATR